MPMRKYIYLWNYVWLGNNVWWATRQRCWWWCVEVNTARVFKFCLWDWILPKGYALRRLHQNKFQKRIFCLIAKRIILYQFHLRLYVAKYTFRLLEDNVTPMLTFKILRINIWLKWLIPHVKYSLNDHPSHIMQGVLFNEVIIWKL